MGIVGGILGSLGGIGLDFSLHLSFATLLGGLGGWLLSWALWSFARRKAEKQASQHSTAQTTPTTVRK